MRSLLNSNFLALLLLLFSPFLAAFASPVAPVSPNEVAPAKNESVELDNAIPTTTSKNLVARATYPDEAECSNAIRTPSRDKSLFFSKLEGRYAIIREYRKAKYETVNQVYPPTFFMIDGDVKDPEFVKFIDRSSRIFAERSSGTVTVLLGEEEPCTTWMRVEFPALKRNDQVEQVISVNPTDRSTKVIYKKGDPIERQGLPPWDGGECLDFSDMSWLN